MNTIILSVIGFVIFGISFGGGILVGRWWMKSEINELNKNIKDANNHNSFDDWSVPTIARQHDNY